MSNETNMCGDAAKLREALKKILDLTNSLDEECAVDPVDIYNIAKAALAAPARNCDVGTEGEQDERFNYYCLKYIGDSCSRCPLSTRKECVVAWMQMPYEEGENHE